MEKELKQLERAEEAFETSKIALATAKLRIGKKIRELRKKKGIQLRVLAAVGAVSAPMLYDVEMGRRFISREKLERIIREL